MRGIYQYGTVYNANSFIQLLGRLRDGGFFYYIKPKFEHQQEKFVRNQAIGLVRGFKKLKVHKLSQSFNSSKFKNWIKNRFHIPSHQRDLSGFMTHFRDALQVIEAKGLGKFNMERDDFIFSALAVNNVDDIEELFENLDKVNFEKYVDRVGYRLDKPYIVLRC